jgi:hypothetical protein
MHRTPRGEELLGVAATALVARPVCRRARGRLVEEEELRVAPRLHQGRAPAPFELEHAGDPTLDLPAPDQVALPFTRQPRFPIIVPRAGSASNTPNAETRFWRVI